MEAFVLWLRPPRRDDDSSFWRWFNTLCPQLTQLWFSFVGLMKLVGFGTRGVRKGSPAAWLQSWLYCGRTPAWPFGVLQMLGTWLTPAAVGLGLPATLVLNLVLGLAWDLARGHLYTHVFGPIWVQLQAINPWRKKSRWERSLEYLQPVRVLLTSVGWALAGWLLGCLESLHQSRLARAALHVLIYVCTWQAASRFLPLAALPVVSSLGLVITAVVLALATQRLRKWMEPPAPRYTGLLGWLLE